MEHAVFKYVNDGTLLIISYQTWAKNLQDIVSAVSTMMEITHLQIADGNQQNSSHIIKEIAVPFLLKVTSNVSRNGLMFWIFLLGQLSADYDMVGR